MSPVKLEILKQLARMGQDRINPAIEMANSVLAMGGPRKEGIGAIVIVFSAGIEADGLELGVVMSVDDKAPLELVKRVLDNVGQEVEQKLTVETKEAGCTCGLHVSPHGTNNGPH